jgi:glycogen synthase
MSGATESSPAVFADDRARTCRRIRRLLITADAVGGVWRYTIDLGRALSHFGVKTTVAVMGPPPDTNQRREATLAGLALVDRPYRLEWMSDADDDVARAGDWLLALEHTLDPDIVHLNGYAHAALPWAAPVVVVAHSCVRSWWRAVRHEEAPESFDQYCAAVSAGLTSARAVVAPTRAMLSAIEREYDVAIVSRVIANGCWQRATSEVAGATAKEPLALAAGRIWDAGKNIAAVCAAAHRVSWPIYVAGATRGPDGIDRSLPGVHALGHLSGEDLAQWYRRAAIYVAPARYEPFGLSILEAASERCALVLGDIPSLRENWSDAAVFVEPDDVPMLERAVQGLIDDPERRVALAERAWQRATRFTIQRTADEYLRLYEALLS